MNVRDAALQRDLDRAAEAANAWTTENHELGGVCDFCGTPLSERPVGVVTYVTGPIVGALHAISDDLGAGTIDFGMDPYWAACAKCDPVVARGDVEEMIEHVITNANRERVGEFTPDAMLRDQLRDLYGAFFAGNPRRHEGREDGN